MAVRPALPIFVLISCVAHGLLALGSARSASTPVPVPAPVWMELQAVAPTRAAQPQPLALLVAAPSAVAPRPRLRPLPRRPARRSRARAQPEPTVEAREAGERGEADQVAAPAPAAAPDGASVGAPSEAAPGEQRRGHARCAHRDRRGRCTGEGAVTDRRAQLARYLAEVRKAVQRARHYPYMAKRMGLEGTVVVRMTIDPHGHSNDVKVLRGSADDSLQRAALAAVRSAGPFPAVPKALGGHLRAEIPISFRLRAR
ncbi:MAG: TonB family protein [Myxococcales bacterium]|nr:TonB family protein [Myxococcales bacterium]